MISSQLDNANRAREADPRRKPVALCSCGRAYDARAWAALGLVGHQRGPKYDLELRNCGCGSTIARTMSHEGGIK